MTTNTALYPLAPKDALYERYVGKSLKDVGAPAAVIDVSIVKQNCQKMLDTVKDMGFGWRVHIKTHKTSEITQLQLGATSNPANIIVSTLIEAEQIVPLLKTYPKHNLLYGLPPGPSSIPRLSHLSTVLGPSGLSLLIDHPAQLSVVRSIHQASSIPPLIIIKIDMGGRRAGVPSVSQKSTDLFKTVVEAHEEGVCIFHGLYAHAGHSYGSSSEAVAMDFLNQEFAALLQAADEISEISKTLLEGNELINLVLSVGATPTTTSIRNLLLPAVENGTSPEQTDIIKATETLRNTITSITQKSHKIELHAGVYPILDLQQLATSALPPSLLSSSNLALTILSEVISVYPERNSILIGTGSISMGKDTCKAYQGYGILTPWNLPSSPTTNPPNPFKDSKFKLSSISQEHGIVTPVNEEDGIEDFEVGQKVRIWPNHACIASSAFGWYLVVDGGDEVVDVWVRFRGW